MKYSTQASVKRLAKALNASGRIQLLSTIVASHLAKVPASCWQSGRIMQGDQKGKTLIYIIIMQLAQKHIYYQK